MPFAHRIFGFVVVGGFLSIAIFGLVLKLAGRGDEPTAFRFVLHWTENLLIVQVLTGIVLLVMGRRMEWLHYFYGSLFPLVAIIAGRIVALRRERQGFVGIAWGALFAFGLSLRALMTGLGIGV